MQGAQEAMAELGAQEAMASWSSEPWRMVFGGLGLGPLGPAPTAGTLIPPPISLGKLGGIRSPPGLNTQHDSTKHNRNALQGQTDRTAHRNQKPSRAGLEAEASSGHDIRGPHRVPQQPLPRQGGRRLEWPPWPQQEEPPAPDESPWTRPT